MTLAEHRRRVDALGQFRVDDPAAPVLTRDAEHHLRRVLRAREGEEIVVTDGAGAWAFARVGAVGLERVSDVAHDPQPTPTTLYLAPLKSDRAEWALAKATEVGVTRVVPLLSAHVVARFSGEARAKTLARWRRVAEEAAGQCRRTFDLEIGEPVAVADVPEDVAVADFSGEGDWSGVRAVAVGPEGGWARDEWGAARRRVALGPHVLRAETAAVVAASLVAFQAGDWGFTLGRGK